MSSKNLRITLSLGVIVAAVLLQALHHVSYLVNDNLAIIESARSGYPVPPVNFLYTALLSGLYALTDIPWHALLLSATLIASMIAIVWSPPRLGVSAVLYLGLVMGLLWPNVLRLDYTVCAVITGAAGIALLIAGAKGFPGKLHRVVTGSVLLAAAALFRLNAEFGLLALAWPGLLYAAYLAARHSSLSKPKCIALMALVVVGPSALVLTADQVGKHAFTPQAYHHFSDYYYARGRLLKQVQTRALSKAAMRHIETATGWNKSDWYQLRHWEFFNLKIRDPDKLRAALAIVRAQPHRSTWWGAVKHTLSAYKRYFLALLMLLGGMTMLRPSWKKIALGAGYLAYVAGFSSWFTYYFGVIGRIWPSFLLASLIVLGAILSIESEETQSKPWSISRILGALVIFASAGMIIYWHASDNLRYLDNSAFAAHVFFARLHKSDLPADSYVLLQPSGQLPTVDHSAYKSLPLIRRSLTMGWMTEHPLTLSRIRDINPDGTTASVPELLVRERNFFMISKPNWANDVRQIAENRSGVKVYLHQCETLPFHFNIYQLSASQDGSCTGFSPPQKATRHP